MADDVQWAKTRTGKSWHIVREFIPPALVTKGLCGKRLNRDTLRDDRPGNEKTCETCLRIGGPK